MKIYVGCDHAGFGLKEKLVILLQELGHEVVDKGAFEFNEGDDYPDFVIPVAKEVSANPSEVRGIILGGSGQGEAIAANRFKNVHATVYYGPAKAVVEDDARKVIELSRADNDSNILSIGARFVTEELMGRAVRHWLETPFSKAERHVRRLRKIDEIHG